MGQLWFEEPFLCSFPGGKRYVNCTGIGKYGQVRRARTWHSLAFLPARSFSLGVMFLWGSIRDKTLGPERRPVQERKLSGTSFWQQKVAAELRDQKGIWKVIGRNLSGGAKAKFHPMNGANHSNGCLVSISCLWSHEECRRNHCLLRFCKPSSHLILIP